MSSSNLGGVFAPCTLYDPKDPTYGATSAPNAFRVFIDNCNNFEPVSIRINKNILNYTYLIL